MPAVVTVTQPGPTVTATPSSSASSTLPAGTIAGIVIGALLGGVLFIVLVLYFLDRYSRHKFTRVANPVHDRVSAARGASDLRYLPSFGSNRTKHFTRHSQRPSISTEPLISPVSWPPLPSTSRVQSPGTPPRSDSISPGIRDSQYSSYEISQVIASGTVSHSATPAILNIPPIRKPAQASSRSLRSGLGDTPPHPRQTSGDDTPNSSTSPKSQQNLFIHRILQSRARASNGVSLAHRPSLDFSQSRSTLDSSRIHVDEDRLLADAERTALRDAEKAQRDREKITPEDEDDWGEQESTASVYSQPSAPIDHSGSFSEPVSRQNSSSSVPRRKPSRRQSRIPAPQTELSPVSEVPYMPRALEGQSGSRLVSTAANSSLDEQASHGTASRPMSSVVDQSGALPLLTSANFGKNSTTSGTPANSISSTAGSGSSSSGKTSRYPSLAPSSIGQSSQSGPRSDVGTDWHHPPSGLAGLASLQIRPLLNPHSPVEEQPEQSDALFAPSPAGPASAKRAHLREGTVSSIPEVERRSVMQGGIAHIDVSL